jgi:hypothetical protein
MGWLLARLISAHTVHMRETFTLSPLPLLRNVASSIDY